MPDHPTEPEPDRDDTDAGYRDTLEEEAYERADSDVSEEPGTADEESSPET